MGRLCLTVWWMTVSFGLPTAGTFVLDMMSMAVFRLIRLSRLLVPLCLPRLRQVMIWLGMWTLRWPVSVHRWCALLVVMTLMFLTRVTRCVDVLLAPLTGAVVSMIALCGTPMLVISLLSLNLVCLAVRVALLVPLAPLLTLVTRLTPAPMARPMVPLVPLVLARLSKPLTPLALFIVLLNY